MSTSAIDPNGQPTTIPDIAGLSIKHPLGPGDHYISQRFGVVSVTGIWHRGVDNPPKWDAPPAVPVLSIRPGVVISTYTYGYEVPGLGSDGSPGGYGNQVHLMHADPIVGTLYSHYAHLKPGTIAVSTGDMVLQGQKLAEMGDTGISRGKHLHWEIRLYDDATRFDPMPYVDLVITPPEPTEEEQLEMSFTPEELAALHKLAALDADGKTFAPGKPGRTALITLMDTVRDLPDDAAREKFNRRLEKMVKRMAAPVTTTPDAQKTLDEWAFALTLP